MSDICKPEDVVTFERAYSVSWSEPCPTCDTVSVIEVWGPEPVNVPVPATCHGCGAELPPPKPGGTYTVTSIDRSAGKLGVRE